jgi:beta-N-acetylglucosaminidase
MSKYVTDKENRINLIEKYIDKINDNELCPLHHYNTEEHNYIVDVEFITNITWLLQEYIKDFTKLAQIENADGGEAMSALVGLKLIEIKDIKNYRTWKDRIESIKNYIHKSQQQITEIIHSNEHNNEFHNKNMMEVQKELERYRNIHIGIDTSKSSDATGITIVEKKR